MGEKREKRPVRRRGGPRRKVPPRLVQAVEVGSFRESEALRLRLSGLTHLQIATRIGVTVPTAWKYVQRGLDKLVEQNADSSDRLRALELARLDTLIAAHWPLATAEDEPDAVRCALIARMIAERAKLQGLYLQDVADAARSIAVAELQEVLFQRQTEALARAKAAGLELRLPFPTAGHRGNGSASSATIDLEPSSDSHGNGSSNGGEP